MTVSDRDRRALGLLAVALVLGFLYWIATRSPSPTAAVAAAIDTPERAEKRLNTLRTALATVDGKEAVLKQAAAELADREKALIPGDTANQAQAQLLQIINRVAKQQTPPMEVRQAEFAQPRPFGEAYGIVSVSVSLDCRTDELVNLVAGLSQQPELVATDEFRTSGANPKTKSMPVRLTVSGLVQRKLVPKKEGLNSF